MAGMIVTDAMTAVSRAISASRTTAASDVRAPASTRGIATAWPRRRKTCATATATTPLVTAGTGTGIGAMTAATARERITVPTIGRDSWTGTTTRFGTTGTRIRTRIRDGSRTTGRSNKPG